MTLNSLKTSTICTLREEDADCYGHITNSRIPTYFDIARINVQNAANLGDSGLRERGVGLLVVAASYTYRGQLFPEQTVMIDSELTHNKRCIWIDHTMRLENRVVATAQTKHLFVDLKTGKAIKSKETYANDINY
ncbi:thioesterase family protein [Candidatus Woesearchaeota archaeon]|nr:thioesterase family protein [Candidatus Woesearchaeota archaeon]